MRRVNLMPPDRLAALARRRRVRCWAVALPAWGVACAAALAVIIALGPEEAGASRARLAQLDQKITALEQADRRLRVELTEWSRRAEAARAAGGWPDWSRLLRLLAALREDGVVLASVSVEPPPASPARGGGGGRAGFSVIVEGVGRTQGAVTSYVLRLERAAVFDAVTLAETRSREFRGEPAVGFRLEAELGRPRPQGGSDATDRR